MQSKSKLVSGFIIGTFVTLYLMVSVISTIHVIDFFKLSNPTWLAISLAVAFEVGAAASLASLIALKKMNKGLVWMLFFLLTAMQAMGNTYYAYVNLENFQAWSELFGLIEEEIIFQKRVLSIVSGAILPIVALGFIKSLVDYIKPEEDEKITEEPEKEETKDQLLVDGGGSLTPVTSESPEDDLTPLNEVIATEEEPAQQETTTIEAESTEEKLDETQAESFSHNGADVIITEQNRRKDLPRVVELPSSSVNPTKL